jgi:hypothetical protein
MMWKRIRNDGIFGIYARECEIRKFSQLLTHRLINYVRNQKALRQSIIFAPVFFITFILCTLFELLPFGDQQQATTTKRNVCETRVRTEIAKVKEDENDDFPQIV